jgi:hypothetical protein
MDEKALRARRLEASLCLKMERVSGLELVDAARLPEGKFV